MKRLKKVSIVYGTVAVILFIVLSAVSFAACANGKDDTLSEERGNMNIDVGEDGMIRNGTEYYTYRVDAGYKGVVSITISKIAGRINLDIYPTDRKDDKEYSGRDLDSASFSVILDESGEYKVRITAKDFVGDYEISWKTEKIEEIEEKEG